MTVSFFVPHRPAPKGSWRPMLLPKPGKKGSPFKADYIVRLLPNNANSEPFQNAVAAVARSMWRGPALAADIPVCLDIAFFYARPDCHYGTTAGKRDRAKLRADAPSHPTAANQYGDKDKLLRTVMDALTDIVYADDRQVCDGRESKDYGEMDGVMITVGAIPPVNTPLP